MSISERISEGLLVRQGWLDRVIARAPYAYKTYFIDKRNGGKRKISQPARETKIVQYWIIENLLSGLPVHSCAKAYVKNINIRDNALEHRNNSFIAKFDLKNFFPSIGECHAKLFFKNNTDLSDPDINILNRILLKNDGLTGGMHLTIGAPSSPMLSNLLMYEFDCAMHAWCGERDVVYTRYADDMVFSSCEKDVLFLVQNKIEDELLSYPYGGFVLNEKKTIFLSKRNSRRVTGLVITNEGEISLGRDKKRLIRSMMHRYCSGTLNEKSVAHLQGQLAFVKSVEPQYLKRLIDKYGFRTVRAIMKKNENVPPHEQEIR